MPDVRSRSRRRLTPLERVATLLARDFPDLDLPLTEHEADLDAGRARAVVVPAARLPQLPSERRDHWAFPEGTDAAGSGPDGSNVGELRHTEGLGLLFATGDRLLEELRRFYLPPVVFAGAGPGGTGTMTVAATRAVAEADVILADGLCGEEVLSSRRPDAVVVPVGKRGGKASTEQEAINDRLLAEALRGRRVVRLTGGDPCVFGRLDEELTTVTARRLRHRVIPGIGAASAAAALVGQPLTVREMASELILSTGRLAGGGKNRFPLEGAAAPAIALYMSRKVLASRMEDLLAAGYPPATPVQVVEKIGSPEARAVQGTIATIVDVVARADVGTPAVVLVGAQYREPDHLPLHGVRIWLPAEAETAATQRARLEELGAICVEVPLIEPEALPVEEGALLARPFDWVLFTSKKSVDFLFALLAKWGYDARWMPKVAAIGGPTVEKLRARGIEPDLVPAEPTRAALSAALIGLGIEDARILIPASAVAPDHVRKTLAPHAREVVRVDLYTLFFPRVETVPNVDVVLFSSESTVRAAQQNGLVQAIQKRGLAVGGIGPGTWRAIERVGLTPHVKPNGTTPEALARAAHLHFARAAVAAVEGRSA